MNAEEAGQMMGEPREATKDERPEPPLVAGDRVRLTEFGRTLIDGTVRRLHEIGQFSLLVADIEAGEVGWLLKRDPDDSALLLWHCRFQRCTVLVTLEMVERYVDDMVETHKCPTHKGVRHPLCLQCESSRGLA